MELTIGTEKYQAEFNMNTIRSIMRDWGTDNFTEMQVPIDLVSQMDFGLMCAYHAINEAAAMRGEPSTFILIADLGRKVRRITELLPAIEAYTEATNELFKYDETEGKPKPRAKARR